MLGLNLSRHFGTKPNLDYDNSHHNLTLALLLGYEF